MDPERETDKWYIKRGSIDRRELDQHHVEPAIADREYLELPKMGKTQFQETIAFLKENGARFDPRKNVMSWYLLPGSDRGKIMNYLEEQGSRKQSVLSKLNENKDKIEKGGKQNQKEHEDIQR